MRTRTVQQATPSTRKTKLNCGDFHFEDFNQWMFFVKRCLHALHTYNTKFICYYRNVLVFLKGLRKFWRTMRCWSLVLQTIFLAQEKQSFSLKKKTNGQSCTPTWYHQVGRIAKLEAFIASHYRRACCNASYCSRSSNRVCCSHGAWVSLRLEYFPGNTWVRMDGPCEVVWRQK